MTKILIVDDHPSFRRGVREYLLEGIPRASVQEANNAEEMWHVLQQTKCDLVILDITMPGLSVLDAIRVIEQLCQSTRILILTMHPEAQYGVRMVQAGADGYLMKSAAHSELIQAVKNILAGRVYISPMLGEALVMGLKPRGEDAVQQLTNREYEVFTLIVRGKTVGQIAKILALSVATISTYRTRILEKLNLETNADIVRYAYERGWREPSDKRQEAYGAGRLPVGNSQSKLERNAPDKKERHH
jgi:two-component system, NarL family, invasion response regulator UvrY